MGLLQMTGFYNTHCFSREWKLQHKRVWKTLFTASRVFLRQSATHPFFRRAITHPFFTRATAILSRRAFAGGGGCGFSRGVPGVHPPNDDSLPTHPGIRRVKKLVFFVQNFQISELNQSTRVGKMFTTRSVRLKKLLAPQMTLQTTTRCLYTP